jgi:hypothetical protein
MGYLGPPSYSPAQTVGSADWNTYVRDNLKAMASNTLLYLGSSITIGAGLTAQANLSAELYDSPDGMGDPTTNHRITIKQAGTYRVYFEVGGATGATNDHVVREEERRVDVHEQDRRPRQRVLLRLRRRLLRRRLPRALGHQRIDRGHRAQPGQPTSGDGDGGARRGMDGAVTYTVPATVSTGGTSTAAQFTAAQASVSAIASKAHASYVSPAGITLAASTTAKVPLNTTVNDSYDGMVDLVNSRIVIRQAGTYRVRLYTIGITSFTWTQFVRKNGAGSLMSQANAFGANYELDWAFASASATTSRPGTRTATARRSSSPTPR